MFKHLFALIISVFLGISLLAFPGDALGMHTSGTLSAQGPVSCQLPCNVTLIWSSVHAGGSVSITRTDSSNNTEVIAPGLPENGGPQSFALASSTDIFKLVSASPVQILAQVATTGTVAAALASCNEACGGSNPSCQSGLTCHNGLCRLPNFLDQTSCTAPTVTTTLQCNAVCGGANTQCQSGLSCININGTNRCRLAGYYDRDNCQEDSAAAVNTVASVAGASTVKKVAQTSNLSNLTNSSNSEEASTPAEVLGETLEAETPEPQVAGVEALPSILSLEGISERVKKHPAESAAVGVGIGVIGTLGYFLLKALMWENKPY